MNYTEFGKHFGQSRQVVAKWEAKGDEFSLITRSTELHIRLAILDLLKTSDKIPTSPITLLKDKVMTLK